MALLTT
jgi:sister-chromatid-cohesion protein PDS5